MFCPKCRAEYREGFDKCVDCQIPLVSQLPPESEGKPDLELVTVLEPADPATLAIAKSLLTEAGIEFIDTTEGLQDFYGVGRLGGIRTLTGPTGLQVATGEHIFQAPPLPNSSHNGS